MTAATAPSSSTPLERDARAGQRARAQDLAGRDRDRRDRRADVGIRSTSSSMRSPRCWCSRRWSSPGPTRSPRRCIPSACSRSPGSGGRSARMIFQWIDKHHGRGVKLTVALFLLGGSTMAIALLPSYAEVGALSALAAGAVPVGAGRGAGRHLGRAAVAARAQCAQGKARLVCDGPAARRAAGPDRRGGAVRLFPGDPVARGFPRAGAGAIPSSSCWRSTSWRCSRGCGWSRRPSSSGCSRAATSSPRRRSRRCSREWRTILLGALAPLASFALFHLVTVFPLSWVTLFTRRSAAALPADRDGRRGGRRAGDARVGHHRRPGRAALRCWACRRSLIGGYSAASPRACSTRGAAGQMAYMLVGFVLLGLAYGQSSGVVNDRFPTDSRYTGRRSSRIRPGSSAPASRRWSRCSWRAGSGCGRSAPTCCRARSARWRRWRSTRNGRGGRPGRVRSRCRA